MKTTDDLDRRDELGLRLSAWMAATAPTQEPAGLVAGAVGRTGSIRQHPAFLVRTGLRERQIAVPDLSPRAKLLLLAALLLVAVGAAAAVGARLLLPPPLNVSPTVTNGWIAFTVGQQAKNGLEEDLDIWLVALDRDARRVIGSETDRVHQLCPAFSPDGRSLAYGRVEGQGTDYFMNADGTEGAQPAAYRQAALVVADVSDDGQVSDRLTIDVGDGLPPPCPVWSPDGGRVAFGVPAYVAGQP